MKHFLQQALRFMSYIFWTMLIIATALMLIELAPKEDGWPYWDKLQHVVVFVILTLAGCLAFPQKRLRVGLSLIAFGALIEIVQGALTITRKASVYDWLADIAGILIAAGIFAVLQKKFASNSLGEK